MQRPDRAVVAGVDVGTEYVKAVVLGRDRRVLGRGAVATRGYFQACVYEALSAALEDAQRDEADLAGLCATGFATNCVPRATDTAPEPVCHALGVFHHLRRPMTLIALGGRDPQVIKVDEVGERVETRGARRCAVGVGSFLMFAARHLDVHPGRLQELASAGDRPAAVSSYCSVFSSSAILEQLREGATREEIALGTLRSIAERIVEIGGLEPPLVATGGVAEFFPGVLRALEELVQAPIEVAPDPLYTAALGAALRGVAA
jgi:predicted CoA-substrate-specific enzyme activase